LGHAQARETGAFLSALPEAELPRRILTSPYLRAIQTAVPLAEALDLRLDIEEGLGELNYVPGLLPSPAARFAYFPHVAATARSLHDPAADGVDEASGRPGESYPLGYLARMLRVAPLLSAAAEAEGSVACFSHAASSALVAALLGAADLGSVGAFAPCGVFHLRSPGRGEPWALVRHGGDNAGHVTENHPSTTPWGHPESSRAAWEALRKGA
jgi:broad specificity phosphatase PhoE